ncbi:MAG TPA: hypothetical protein VES38_03950 [Methylotenera sp.]|nr:hypothetical protein [Methylotenera sp.]
MFDRFFSAIIAPIIFNIAVVITLGILSSKSYNYLFRVSFGDISSLILGYTGQKLFILFVIIPAIYGLVFGSRGVSEFIGHAFYTNTLEQKNKFITCSIWLIILATAYLAEINIFNA